MSTAKAQGFTLPELLTSIAVFAVVVSASLPNLTNYVQKNAVESDINLIKALLYHARTSAINSGQHVTVCVLEDLTKCHKTANWSGTVTSFVDPNKNGIIDHDESITQVVQVGKQASSITWRSFNRLGYLQFSPLGLSTSSNGTFTYCPKAHNTARKLVVNRQGRLKIRDQSHTNARCQTT